MPKRPNSKPSKGSQSITAVVAVKPISEDKIREPQALQPRPKKLTAIAEKPRPVSRLKANCFLK